METIKSVVGLGSSKEKDEEPVSGQTGEGTIAEPYDAGNSNEAQEAAKALPEQQDQQKPTETDPANTAEPTTAPTTETQGSNTALGGSWLKSAIPFVGSKKSEDTSDQQASVGAFDTSNQQASAGASDATASQPAAPIEDESTRPPNHLGVNVPSGHSLDFADPQPEQPSPTDTKKEQKMPSTEPTQTEDQSSPLPSGSASKSPQSPAPLRGSRASIAAPAGTRVFNPSGQNPGRIPTAGGRVLGEGPSEDRRRRSVWSQSDGTKSDMPPLDKQGSPDPVTQGNTVSNTVPAGTTNGEGSSKAAAAAPNVGIAPTSQAEKTPKPDFNTFAWGEGGEGAASTTPSTTVGKETDESKASTSLTTESEAPSKTEQVKEKVKEAVPSSGAGSGSGNVGSGTAGKERRMSRFAGFKEKMGIGKGKS